MPRYRNRRLQLRDLVPRFESEPSAIHCRNAVAAIQRLRDDRREFCQDGSAQDTRWLEACDALHGLITGMSRTREIEGQSLAKAMREFVQEFEHSTKRIDQILHAELPDRMTSWIKTRYTTGSIFCFVCRPTRSCPSGSRTRPNREACTSASTWPAEKSGRLGRMNRWRSHADTSERRRSSDPQGA